MTDPRKAKNLEEAARNPDGSYNAIKALSWLSDVVTGGKGIPESEVAQIAKEVQARRSNQLVVAKPIPIAAAERIAKQYGYEQIVIYARRTGQDGCEHMTTYGVNPTHCSVAARMGRVLKQFMGWNCD